MDLEQSEVQTRCLKIAEYILESKATVRQAAGVFGVSKSTVHKDMTERLGYYHPELKTPIREILEENKAQRHLRGGDATKRKYHEQKGSQKSQRG